MLVAGNFLSYNTQDTSKVDTLRTVNTTNGYLMDTISMLDSVRFVIILGSYTNNLVSFSAEWDTTALTMNYDISKILEALDVNNESFQVTPGKVNLIFKTTYNYASFPVSYQARKTGDHLVNMAVTSDSKFPENKLKFIQPVR